ncbi:uncharacterized protein LOC111041449 [Myzus persicae]|uniref:uncharacterized protein LOC111041449 n=1 Tax=Myzus persicae TaxID=13164 RepID=UPI000B93268B|nr:uncharacterized protein LOC111041449 [Myzus persicae]
MPRQRKDVTIDYKTIISMMRHFGIHQYTMTILKQLSGFNHQCVSVIFEEAILCARKSNRKRTNIKDLQTAILKARNGTIPVISPHKDTGQKRDIIDTDIEIINDKLSKISVKKFNRQLDDTLPDLGYFDLEEFIRSIQANQDTNEKKFDVDSLLNDPHSL